MNRSISPIKEEPFHRRLSNGKKIEGDNLELLSKKEAESKGSYAIDDFDVKILKSPKVKRIQRSTLRRASTGNNLRTEIKPVYQVMYELQR